MHDYLAPVLYMPLPSDSQNMGILLLPLQCLKMQSADFVLKTIIKACASLNKCNKSERLAIAINPFYVAQAYQQEFTKTRFNIQNTFIIFKTRFKCLKRVANVSNALQMFETRC